MALPVAEAGCGVKSRHQKAKGKNIVKAGGIRTVLKTITGRTFKFHLEITGVFGFFAKISQN